MTKLASKFQVRVKFGEKVGRKKNVLSEGEVDWVMFFANRPDISYTTFGRKDNIYVGIFNKAKKFIQKRYILCTTRETLDIINVSELLESSKGDNFCFKSGKDITFRQIYDLLKRQK